MTIVIKCHSLNNDILNANMTLSLLWHLDINPDRLCIGLCHDNL